MSGESEQKRAKREKIAKFNPNAASKADAGIFGLPFSVDDAEIVVLPVPWEVTVSYSAGTAQGPQAIFEASAQTDLFDPVVKDAWKIGIAMADISESLLEESNSLRQKATKCIDIVVNESDPELSAELTTLQHEIAEKCRGMNQWVKVRSLELMNKGKIVALLGGDHSTPLGLINALGEKIGDFAILQIDAHADLREAFEGFEYSHASIMYNALKNPKVKKLVQVGIRDYCQEEYDRIVNSEGRVACFFDRDLKQAQYRGESWDSICDRIIKELPQVIYLSFDIDGLDPKLCPNTGTPVAGGLESEQLLMLIEKVVSSGRKIVAFDINEVAPAEDNDWDANVAARLLYRISNLVAVSNGCHV